MIEQNKVTLTFSFSLPTEDMSKAEIDKMIKNLVSNGSIGLTLPKGSKGLNLEACKVDIPDKYDEYGQIILDTHTDRLQAALDMQLIRMSENHKR